MRWARRSVQVNRNFALASFQLAAALAELGRLAEARLEVKAGLAIVPTFTIARFRASASGAHPTLTARRERLIESLRAAGRMDAPIPLRARGAAGALGAPRLPPGKSPSIRSARSGARCARSPRLCRRGPPAPGGSGS